jgi:hypothetical protein
MLNSAPGHLLSIPKTKNKVKVNVEKMIFYNFEALNAQITRKSFFISKLNYKGVLVYYFSNGFGLRISGQD